MKKKIIVIGLLLLLSFAFVKPLMASSNNNTPVNFANLVYFVKFKDESDPFFESSSNHNAILSYYDDTTNDRAFSAYMKTISYGQFIVKNSFPQDNGTTFDAYELSHDKSYYENYGSAAAAEYLLMKEVIENVGYNGSATIDYNNDGFADNVTFIILGNTEDRNSFMYAHKANFSGDNKITGTTKGVGTYNVIPTGMLMDSISGKWGVISHEFLHSIGFPDLYSNATDYQFVGTWDIMAKTSIYTQYPLSYMRSMIGNWISIDTIDKTQRITLSPQYVKDGKQAYILRTPLSSTEFFVVEARQKTNSIPSDGRVQLESKIGGTQMGNGETGVILYRVNTNLTPSNITSTGDENAWIYVFRPNSVNGSSDTDRQSNITYSYLSQNSSRVSYGTSNLSDIKTADTIYYSDGSNSGITIKNVRNNNDGTITLDVVFPDYTSIGLWDNELSSTSFDRETYSFSLVEDNNQSLYLLSAQYGGEGKVYKKESGSWSALPSFAKGVYSAKTTFYDGNLYALYLDASSNLKASKYTGSSWSSAGVIANNVTYFDVSSGQNGLYVVYVNSNDSGTNILNTSKLNAGKSAFSPWAVNIASGLLGNPKICANNTKTYCSARNASGNKLTFYDITTANFKVLANFPVSATTYDIALDANAVLHCGVNGNAIYKYENNLWTKVGETNASVQANISSALRFYNSKFYLLSVCANSTVLYEQDGSVWKKIGYNIDQGADDVSLLLRGGVAYAAYSLSDADLSSTKIYLKSRTLPTTQSDPEVKVSSISLSFPSSTVTLGVASKVNLNVYPISANNKNVTYSIVSGDASIDSSGKVTPKKLGTLTVRVVAKDGSGISATATVTVLPSTCQGLKVYKYSYNYVTLSFSPQNGATGYEIYRSVYSNKKFSKIATTTSEYYKNSSLTIGKYYYYKVRSYVKVGTRTYYSDFSSVLKARALPETPFGFTASAYGSTSVKLKWNKVSGASGYVIYRSTSLNGKYSKIKTVTKGTTLSYTNTSLHSNKMYYYKIRAYKTVSRTKYYGSTTAIGVLTSPTKPKISVKNISYNRIDISFSRPSGAVKFRLYRSTSPTTGFSLLCESSERYYSDTNVTAKRKYYYKVYALNLVSSSNSSSVTSCYALPAKPTLSLSTTSKKVTIKVSPITDVTGYKIYRAASKNGRYSYIGEITDLRNLSFINSGLKKGRMYYYKIRAYKVLSTGRVYSPYSAIKCIKCK